MTSSASRCSSTTTARRPTARAPAAPARTSTTPARSPSRIGIPHYVLDYESRFKETVIDRSPRAMSRARRRCRASTATCRSSSRTCSTTARDLGARVLATGHYVASRPLPDGGRALYRARDAERDQSYFLFATTPRAARLPALSARRQDQGGDARAGAALRACGRRQARQPGHLLRADRPLHRRRSSGCGRAPPSPATSSISPAGCSAATTASSISRSASGAASASPPAIRSMWSGSMPRPGASSSGRARRCARSRMQLRDVNWIGDGALDEALADDRREVFVKVRSTRPPQPAWLRRSAAARVRRSRSSWPAARTAFRPDRPASSMMRRTASRGCWAADSSRMWPIRPASRPLEAAPAGTKPAVSRAYRPVQKWEIKKYFMTTPHNAGVVCYDSRVANWLDSATGTAACQGL